MQNEINKCIEVLKSGGIILYPTDTVWGIGCDATNEEAVKKIYELKQREDSKSMIVLVSSDAMLQKYVVDVPPLAWDIIDLATKPTTIIYPKARLIAKNAVAIDGSVGIRMVKNNFAHHLIQKFNKPIISTSANISGKSTPLTFQNIDKSITTQVLHVVNQLFDNGNHNPSSIISLNLKGEIKVLRK
ncbi:MAG: threonylcarbamoyl-AMP synthase [Flavobacteriales bacterium]|nr:threonylcarbamoyl-AMP synthase [Flavobacteriales bacterium]